jgi:hypothetical protein
MYYVIKKHTIENPSQYISFQVEKFIANKNNDTVIFELKIDGKIVRKWVKKDEIILLTQDREFFIKTLQQFRALEETQKELVANAQAQLEKSIEIYSETMLNEIEKFEEIKDANDFPCILKEI